MANVTFQIQVKQQVSISTTDLGNVARDDLIRTSRKPCIYANECYPRCAHSAIVENLVASLNAHEFRENRLSNIHRAGLILICCLAIASCIPSKINVIQSADKFETLPVDSGLVVARVVDSGGNRVPLNYLTLAPKDVLQAEENKYVRIPATTQDIGGLSYFVGVVEANQYSLSDLYGLAWYGDYSLSRYVSIDPTFGTFAVRPGQVTNLGTLIYYPKPDGDVYHDFLVRNDSFDEAPKILGRDYDALASRVSNLSEPLTWDEDDYADERWSNYLSAVQNPITFDKSIQFDDELVVMSRVGSLLRYEDGGSWRVDGIDSDLSILMIDRNSSGDEAISGQGGELYWRPAGEAEWQKIKPPLDYATLRSVQIDDARHLHVFSESLKEISLFTANAEPDPEWTQNLVFRTDRLWVSPSRDREISTQAANDAAESGRKRSTTKELEDVSFLRSNGQVLITVQGRLFEINPVTSQATTIDPGFNIASIEKRGNQYVSRVASGFWTTGQIASYRASSDLDGKWQKIPLRLDQCPDEELPDGKNRCPVAKVVKFRSATLMDEPYYLENGDAIALMQHSMRSNRSGTFFARLASDKHWVEIVTEQEAPKYCNRILGQRGEFEVLVGCSGTTGKIFAFDYATGNFELLREPASF